MTKPDAEKRRSGLRSLRKPALAVFGLALGMLFLWLALRQVNIRDAGTTLQNLGKGYLLLAVMIYWISIAFRIFRWRRMLAPYYPGTLRQIADTLVVGFAVNYILPARLGELFRADYAKRRFGISRSAALGSIAVERLMDGTIVISLLWLGLLLATKGAEFQAADQLWAIEAIAKVGTALFITAIVCMLFIVRYRIRLTIGPDWMRVRTAAFVDGLATVDAARTWRVLSLSLAVWGTEVLALWLIFRSLSVELSLGVALMVTGTATLSSLVPTAPGFVGSYQLVFIMVMKAVGVSPEIGLLAATTIQVAFFGSVTLVGLGIFISRHLSGIAKAFGRTRGDESVVRRDSKGQ